MTTRDHTLRLQAETTCARRTIELEDARSALARQAEDAELGRAVRKLEAQTTRLGRTPGVPFEFTPDGAAKAMANELAEVKDCEPGSPAARMELGDLLSTVISAFKIHRAPLLTTVMAATSKLERRLDHVDAGASWDDAKRADLECDP